jgi:hypothetical protein
VPRGQGTDESGGHDAVDGPFLAANVEAVGYSPAFEVDELEGEDGEAVDLAELAVDEDDVVATGGGGEASAE